MFVRPYDAFKINFQEMINEISILIVACLLFGLTDALKDFETKYKVGWAIIYVILANLVVNIIILVAEMIIGIKNKIAEWRKKRQEAKYKDKNGDKIF